MAFTHTFTGVVLCHILIELEGKGTPCHLHALLACDIALHHFQGDCPYRRNELRASPKRVRRPPPAHHCSPPERLAARRSTAPCASGWCGTGGKADCKVLHS